MRVHQTGKKAVAEAISGMKWDEALRLVGIQLQILTFKEHGSRKQNRIPGGEPAGALEEKGGAGQVSSESHQKQKYRKCRDYTEQELGQFGDINPI